MTNLQAADARLVKQLDALTSGDVGYWSFTRNSERGYSHDYFQYPAMMVPQMLSDLIRSVIQSDPKIHSIFDPFAGSGTVLAESMLHGKHFLAADINPLAVLLCKTKAGPFYPDLLEDRIDELTSIIEEDVRTAREAYFRGMDKWFEPHLIVELSRIRRAIRSESRLWCRRFFWVALAETIRLTSNSRTSTFKLHIRSSQNIEERKNVSAIATFSEVLERNLESYCEQGILLKQLDLLNDGRYRGIVRCEIKNATEPRAISDKCDLLITSPPYGDNTTTVPYGQSSYLPLNWIDLQDIDPTVDYGSLVSTHEIDRRSLGGAKKGALEDVQKVADLSPALNKTLKRLAIYPRDRGVRVAAFFKDLDLAMDAVIGTLRDHAYMIWIVGNRRVGGVEIPTASIISELLVESGCKHVVTIDRNIPTKRMALRNNLSKTMTKEAILVFRRN